MLRTASAMQSAGLGPEALGLNNPFAPPGAQTGTPGTGQGTSASTPPAGNTAANPFGMVDPNMLQQLFGGYGGLPTALGGAGNPPVNTRPPEERFEEQLQQLREMGFVNASQNVRALMATGGNVQMAIEYILGGGGL
jgi:ubiquilin